MSDTSNENQNDIIEKQEGEKTYPYLSSIYNMYVLNGVEKMTEIGLNAYIDQYCPFMPAELQKTLRNMDIGGQLSESQIKEILDVKIYDEMIANPKTW